MNCALCGNEFDEEKAARSCRSCYMMKCCKLIKCPKCGFEMPPEPKWIKYFKKKGILK